MNKQILEESKNVAKESIKTECKVTTEDFRTYEKITDKAKKSAFLN